MKWKIQACYVKSKDLNDPLHIPSSLMLCYCCKAQGTITLPNFIGNINSIAKKDTDHALL